MRAFVNCMSAIAWCGLLATVIAPNTKTQSTPTSNKQTTSPTASTHAPSESDSVFDRGMDAVEKNKMEEAISLFQRSASLGNARAMNYLGWLYVKGTGVPQDYKQAQDWYEK